MKCVIVLYAVFFAKAWGFCYIDGLQCCLTEFLTFVSADYGFGLTATNMNRTCMTMPGTFDCLDSYEEQCAMNDELRKAIGDSKTAVTEICSPNSRLSGDVTDAACLIDSSSELKKCAKTAPYAGEVNVLDQDVRHACCDYKELKDCAIKISKEKCNQEVVESVEYILANITGLGYELACKDSFQHCGATALLLSSMWLLLFSTCFSFSCLQ